MCACVRVCECHLYLCGPCLPRGTENLFLRLYRVNYYAVSRTMCKWKLHPADQS